MESKAIARRPRFVVQLIRTQYTHVSLEIKRKRPFGATRDCLEHTTLRDLMIVNKFVQDEELA